MNAIRAVALTRRFGSQIAVNGIDLDVPCGAIFGFLGPNGSGKTVTIKMLTGLLTPSGGDAWVAGIDVQRDPEDVRRAIGYMSQKFSLYDDLSVHENLRFYGMAYGLKGARLANSVEDAIQRNALGSYRDRWAGRLSGGWKQRLALACAMLHQPAVLFLDEPTAGIDPVARRQLWDLLFELSAAGMTFFVTTHYMDEAERCSQLAYIYYGHLIAEGSPEALRARPDINPEGTSRFEVVTSASSRSLHILKRLDGVRSATLFGRTVHVLVNADLNQQTLRQQLTEAGLTVDDVRPLTPSLEDVFVELTERRQRELERLE